MGENDGIGRLCDPSPRLLLRAICRATRRVGVSTFLLLFALSGSALYPLPARESSAAAGGETPVTPATPGTPAQPVPPQDSDPSDPSGDSAETILVTLTGRIAIKGNMPHTMVVLTVTDGSGEKTDYQITGPLSDEIGRRYQNRTVTIQGRITREALGPGFPARLEAENCKPARTQ